MKKYNSIDVSKFIMSIMVVFIHVYKSEFSGNRLYTIIVSLAVPFFFIASGFLLGMRINKGNLSSSEINNVLNKSIIKYIKIYLIWNLIYLPLALVPFIKSSDFIGGGYIYIIKVFLSYIRGFLFVGQQYNSWILWYILSTIYALILIKILVKFKLNLGKILCFGICIGLIISSLFTFLVNNIEMTNGILKIMATIIKSSIGNGRILKGLFYLPLGLYLSTKNIKLEKSFALFVIGFIICIFIPEFLFEFSLAICSTGLFLIIIRINLKNHIIYSFLRSMSTTIYFIHLWIWTIYYYFLFGVKVQGLDHAFIVLAISIIIGIVRILICKKIKKV